jgi:hypothetical protein
MEMTAAGETREEARLAAGKAATGISGDWAADTARGAGLVTAATARQKHIEAKLTTTPLSRSDQETPK